MKKELIGLRMIQDHLFWIIHIKPNSIWYLYLQFAVLINYAKTLSRVIIYPKKIENSIFRLEYINYSLWIYSHGRELNKFKFWSIQLMVSSSPSWRLIFSDQLKLFLKLFVISPDSFRTIYFTFCLIGGIYFEITFFGSEAWAYLILPPKLPLFPSK